MKYLIKTELYKLKKTYSTWCILFIMVAACSISIFTGVYNSGEQTFVNISKDIMVSIFACAIYAGITLSSDFSNRTVIHYIMNGHKRFDIILAQFIRYSLGSMIILILYPFISTLLTILIKGTESSLNIFMFKMIFNILESLPLYLAIISLFFMITVLIRHSTISMGTSIVTAIFLVVFTNKIYFAANTSKSILHFSPVIQLQLIPQDINQLSETFITYIISLLVILFILFITNILFNKAELK